MSYWYISFAGPKFLGATVVRAPDPAVALRFATLARVNPGGEAAITRVPANAEVAFKPWLLRLMSRREAVEFDGSHPELVEANRAAAPEVHYVCQRCNEDGMTSCGHGKGH